MLDCVHNIQQALTTYTRLLPEKTHSNKKQINKGLGTGLYKIKNCKCGEITEPSHQPIYQVFDQRGTHGLTVKQLIKICTICSSLAVHDCLTQTEIWKSIQI